jgi:hypothetical protein
VRNGANALKSLLPAGVPSVGERVAAGYAVIGWLLLQIADVTFEPATKASPITLIARSMCRERNYFALASAFTRSKR